MKHSLILSYLELIIRKYSLIVGKIIVPIAEIPDSNFY